MATYISGVRQKLYDALKVEGSLHDWEHIIKQIGMFCYSGLDSEQVNLTSSWYSRFVFVFSFSHGTLISLFISFWDYLFIGSQISYPT